eukprot:jgi/Tetstr1/449343/TSEL_003856.t1
MDGEPPAATLALHPSTAAQGRTAKEAASEADAAAVLRLTQHRYARRDGGGEPSEDWQQEFLRAVEDPIDVEEVPSNLTKMMLLAVERVYNPDLKEDDPMLNPAIREQLRAQGFSIDGGSFAGGMPADGGRAAGMQRIRRAHRSETVPLADDFEPGFPELWHQVDGGMVSADCGSVEGEALCFDQPGARQVVSAPLRLLGGASVRFALWMSPTDEPAPVVLEYQVSGSEAWQRVATFGPQSYRLPAPSNPNTKFLVNGDASDHAGFVYFSVPLTRAADSGATRLRWMQVGELASGADNATHVPGSWALDNIDVELNAAARPAVILTVSEDIDAVGSSGLVSVVAQFSEPVIGFDRLRVKVSGGTLASVSRLTGTIAGQGEMYSVHIVPHNGADELALQILEGAGVTKGGAKSMASNSVAVVLGAATTDDLLGVAPAGVIDLDATGFVEEQADTHPTDELAASSNVQILQTMHEMQRRIEYLEREVRRLQQVETDLQHLKNSLLRRPQSSSRRVRRLGMDLKSFIYRAAVLAQYRQFVRVVRQAPTEARGELQQQVRHHFEAQRGVREAEQIKYLLSDGKQQLKRLREMIGLASGTL